MAMTMCSGADKMEDDDFGGVNMGGRVAVLPDDAKTVLGTLFSSSERIVATPATPARLLLSLLVSVAAKGVSSDVAPYSCKEPDMRKRSFMRIEFRLRRCAACRFSSCILAMNGPSSSRLRSSCDGCVASNWFAGGGGGGGGTCCCCC